MTPEEIKTLEEAYEIAWQGNSGTPEFIMYNCPDCQITYVLPEDEPCVHLFELLKTQQVKK